MDSTILKLNKINNITSDLSFPVSSNESGKEIAGQIDIASIYNYIKTQLFNELGLESNNSNELTIIDDNGYVGVKINSQGVYAKDFIDKNGNKLSNKLDRSEFNKIKPKEASSLDDAYTKQHAVGIGTLFIIRE